MSSKNAILGMFFLAFTSGQVQAEILFEAFYRIEKNGRHTGYVVQRVSSDGKGHKTASTYVRTKFGDKELFSTSKSVAKAGKGTPVESVHSSDNTGAPFRIAADFKDNQGLVTFYSSKSKKSAIVEKAQPAPFPSAFLFYAADLPKLQHDKKYNYTAFFEESGRTQVGQLSVLGSKAPGPSGAKNILHVLNDDSGQPVENFIAESGEPLGSRSEVTGSVCFWVATKEEAVGTMTYPTGEMTSLFGDLPQGKKNPWSTLRGFDSSALIKSFQTWDGNRSVSSTPATSEVLPLPLVLPVRGL
ncbi:MAG: hypothetical protein HC883_01915 [Bdellovibrionaceae bacterium]|nr:hypothetical protein [Pseudobdellovibrionaceae bacterium]